MEKTGRKTSVFVVMCIYNTTKCFILLLRMPLNTRSNIIHQFNFKLWG